MLEIILTLMCYSV